MSAAALIGVDPATDLALLKIDAKNLPTIPWGDSSKLRIAEWVLAIGNPYQLNSTVTLGIVSAVNRTNLGISAYEDFVQTDAAINPGNSGGALVNARGELVGINTVIFSQSGGYQGIGFAVSANLAKRVLNDLRQYGEVRRGTIGYIQVLPLTPQLAQELAAPDTQGLAIAGIGRSAVDGVPRRSSGRRRAPDVQRHRDHRCRPALSSDLGRAGRQHRDARACCGPASRSRCGFRSSARAQPVTPRRAAAASTASAADRATRGPHAYPPVSASPGPAHGRRAPRPPPHGCRRRKSSCGRRPRPSARGRRR